MRLPRCGSSLSDALQHCSTALTAADQLRSGSVRLATPEGQWAFGLALMKESEQMHRRESEAKFRAT